MMLAWDHPNELTVAKGYALWAGSKNVWLGHWWCVDQEGRVVDPSWKNDGGAYVAVEFIDPVAYAKRLGSHWELDLPNVAHPELVAALEHAAGVASVLPALDCETVQSGASSPQEAEGVLPAQEAFPMQEDARA